MTTTRRRFIGQGFTTAGFLGAQAPTARVVDNPKGGFRFLRGLAPFSSGAAALGGFEVVHVIFSPAPPYRRGFELMDGHLKEEKRPPQALCGVELRSPKPFTFEGFGQFNQGYVEELKRRSLILDGMNPVARTNVAPEMNPPAEVLMYGFSYTAPARRAGPSFVLAGAGEVKGDQLAPEAIVRRGDTSAAGLRDKAAFVLGLLEERLRELGAGWGQVTTVGVYTVHDLFPLIQKTLLPRLGAAAAHGLRWYYARPPIQELEFEMDARGCPRELVISA